MGVATLKAERIGALTRRVLMSFGLLLRMPLDSTKICSGLPASSTNIRALPAVGELEC